MFIRAAILFLFASSSLLRAVETNVGERIDALIASSTLVGQNRGWVAQPAGETKGARFDLQLTAARSFILCHETFTNHRADVTKIVRQCANALMLAQQPSGYVPSYATFLRAGARAELDPSPVLPRNATAAAAAFLLVYASDSNDPQPRAAQAARQAVNWLVQQQLGVGGFPAPTTQPNTGQHPVRQIDLTTTGYRNTLLALLLANELQPSRPLSIAAEKAANRLLALRLMNQAGAPATRPQADDTDDQRKIRAALQLWAGRYEAAGEIAPDNPSADLQATSQAIDALLAEALIDDNPKWASELQLTRTALMALHIDGKWSPKIAALPTTQPTTDAGESVFGPARTPTVPGTFHLPPLLALIDDLQTLARPEVVKKLEKSESLADRLAATICGLRATLMESADTIDGRLWMDLHR